MKISKKRQRGLEFHIETRDYFATLATLLDLSRQTLGETARERFVANSLAKSVDDLMYLQRHFKIVRIK